MNKKGILWITGLFVLILVVFWPGENTQKSGSWSPIPSSTQSERAVAPVTAVIELATGESHREYVQAKGISWDVVEGCVEATAANSRGSKETRQVCAGEPDHQWPPATYYEYVAFGGNAVIRFNR